MEQNIEKEIKKNLSDAIQYSLKPKTQIAKEVGIDPSTLSQYLSGRIMPSLVTFKILCEVLDVSSDDILNLKSESV